MGIATVFDSGYSRLTATQHSDFVFLVEVLQTTGTDIDGNPITEIVPAADFDTAEYLIADSKGRVIVRKALNDGITISGDNFKVHIEDTEMIFAGSYKHQFTVITVSGIKLDPIFAETLRIVPALI